MCERKMESVSEALVLCSVRGRKGSEKCGGLRVYVDSYCLFEQ
jgi:hypothetical protein